MTDVLIRNVPEDELRLIDAMAEKAGISRNDFLRRQIHQLAGRRGVALTQEDFVKFAGLDDEDLMRKAWS